MSSSSAASSSPNRSSSPSVLDPLPEMPLLPITSEATLTACRSFLSDDADEYDKDDKNNNKHQQPHHSKQQTQQQTIFVCSYPKSGTTWTQNLVCRLLAAALGQTLPDDWHLSHSAPFYEVDAYWDHHRSNSDCDNDKGPTSSTRRVPAQTPLQKPISSADKNHKDQEMRTTRSTTTTTFRVFNTHLQPHQLPDEEKTNVKCIYVMRNALDVLVSFYHHMVHMAECDGGYTQSPKAFCRDFVQGTIAYGKWQHHMEAWLATNRYSTAEAMTIKSRKRKNVLFLHYQDMKQDLEREATRVARFLLSEAERTADHQQAFLSKIVQSALPHCTFDAMRAERVRYTPQSVSWKVDSKTGEPYRFCAGGTDR